MNISATAEKSRLPFPASIASVYITLAAFAIGVCVQQISEIDNIISHNDINHHTFNASRIHILHYNNGEKWSHVGHIETFCSIPITLEESSAAMSTAKQRSLSACCIIIHKTGEWIVEKLL